PGWQAVLDREGGGGEAERDAEDDVEGGDDILGGDELELQRPLREPAPISDWDVAPPLRPQVEEVATPLELLAHTSPLCRSLDGLADPTAEPAHPARRHDPPGDLVDVHRTLQADHLRHVGRERGDRDLVEG